MAYLYRHIRLDKNVPFYVGIGKYDDGQFKRAHSVKNRNVYWNNIVNSTSYKVQIVLSDLTWEQACEKEIEFIALYKKNTDSGTLCNISDGGNGGFLSEEVNKKRSKTLKGHKVSEETKMKIANKAMNRKASPETKKKMSEVHKKNKTGHWLDNVGHKNGRAYKVDQYDLNNNFIKTWDCAKYAVDFHKIHKSCITECIHGRQKTAGGYIWKKNNLNDE
jgi:hypothetical protein